RSSASRWPGTPVIGSSASSRSQRSGPAGSGSVSADTISTPRRTTSGSWAARSCRASSLRSGQEVRDEEASVRHGERGDGRAGLEHFDRAISPAERRGLVTDRLAVHLEDSIHQIDDPVIGNAGPGVDVFLYVPDRGPGWTH